MNASRALIVDDSKTAQHLLKKMLQKYNLKIDAVSSAEEALSYLADNHPSVIFLDQQMTGMTGMEVLKMIKENPDTALIPVIMYTSQQDDLFVSQAIALGAQDILSKGAMQPANLERVLQVLNIAPVPESNATIVPNVSPITPSPVKVSLPTQERSIQDLDRVRSQISRLFEVHVADVRTQIDNSTQFTVRRLSTLIEKSANRDAVISDASLAAVKLVVKNIVAAERKRIAMASNALLAAILVGVGFLGYTLWQIEGDLKQASQNLKQASQNHLAASEDKKQKAPAIIAPLMTSHVPQEMAESKTNIAPNAPLLRAMGTVQNTDSQFPHSESP